MASKTQKIKYNKDKDYFDTHINGAFGQLVGNELKMFLTEDVVAIPECESFEEKDGVLESVGLQYNEEDLPYSRSIKGCVTIKMEDVPVIASWMLNHYTSYMQAVGGIQNAED